MEGNIAKMYIDGFTPDAYAQTGLDYTKFARGKRKCGGAKRMVKRAGRRHHRVGMRAGKKNRKNPKRRAKERERELAPTPRNDVEKTIHPKGRKSKKDTWSVKGHTRHRRYN